MRLSASSASRPFVICAARCSTRSRPAAALNRLWRSRTSPSWQSPSSPLATSTARAGSSPAKWSSSSAAACRTSSASSPSPAYRITSSARVSSSPCAAPIPRPISSPWTMTPALPRSTSSIASSSCSPPRAKI